MPYRNRKAEVTLVCTFAYYGLVDFCGGVKMSELVINGQRPLHGEISIHGAKNAVLPILAACILNPGECVLHNCPDLKDVTSAIEILKYLGCTVQKDILSPFIRIS